MSNKRYRELIRKLASSADMLDCNTRPPFAVEYRGSGHERCLYTTPFLNDECSCGLSISNYGNSHVCCIACIAVENKGLCYELDIWRLQQVVQVRRCIAECVFLWHGVQRMLGQVDCARNQPVSTEFLWTVSLVYMLSKACPMTAPLFEGQPLLCQFICLVFCLMGTAVQQI